MAENGYFSPHLTGGAISQRGFRYQILVSIKYLIENLSDPEFVHLAVEQEDDFALHFKNTVVQCQAKSVLFGIKDLRAYLDSKSLSMPSILVCSAFSSEIQNLMNTRKWYEVRIKNHGQWENTDEITANYINELKKKQIDFLTFQTVTLDAIPLDYSETIAKNAVAVWVQKNKRNINIEALLEALYVEISRKAAARGTLSKSEVMTIIERCRETQKGVYASLGLMESDNDSTREHTPQNRWIYYTENQTEKGIYIKPSMTYWNDIINNSKPMIPITYIWEPFAWEFPNLDVKVLNNTKGLLYLTEIEFEVVSSKPDPSPLLYIKESPFSSNNRHLALYNDGWGTLKNVSIRINSSPVENKDFSVFGASENLGTIDEYRSINLTHMLHTLTGIDFSGFDAALNRKTHSNCFMYDRNEMEPGSNLFKYYLGDYAKGVAFVNGILDFDADALEEENRHYSIPFSAAVELYDYHYPGVPAPPSYQYDIQLRVSGESYIVRKSISHVMKPGEIDRFNVRVHCDQSSRHFMNIYLKDITGKRIQMSNPVQLDMCVPRSGLEFVSEQTKMEQNPCHGTLDNIMKRIARFISGK